MNFIIRHSLVALLILSNVLLSQQGKYIRKSVSSLESIFYNSSSIKNMEIDLKTFDKLSGFYIETERFDYNILPEKMLNDFKRRSQLIPTISPESLSEIIEISITSKITDILNDPDVIKQRSNNIKNESALQSFAATKGKSLGLNAQELKILMNSAYIYLPFISSAKSIEKIDESSKKEELEITINGGIIWWKMETSADGNTILKKVLSRETSGKSLISHKRKKPLDNNKFYYDSFRFGNEEWEVTPEQYCQADAMLSFCKNLGLITKTMDDFKLSAQILEANGKNYAFSIGKREGVYKDDVYNIIEYEEDSMGNYNTVIKGHVRVKNTGDNEIDPNNLTYAKQLLGEKVSEGAIVIEVPRSGEEANIKLISFSGFLLPKESILDMNGDELFKEDISSGYGFEGSVKYNIAPIINISQTFIDLNLLFGLPTFKSVDGWKDDGTALFPWSYSIHAGASKKLWLGSNNMTLSLGLGLDSYNVSGTASVAKYRYSSIDLSYRYSLEFEKLLTTNYALNIGVFNKVLIGKQDVSVTYADADAFSYDENDFPNLSLNTAGFSLGITSFIGESDINLFGWLDPFKKF